jgi:hypothetical protein
MPTTFGTGIGLGPLETLIRTCVPSTTISPAFGACAVTELTSSPELISTTRKRKFASRSAATASSRLRPTTLGTCTFGLPLETKMVTKLPRSMRTGGSGSCE